MENIIITPKNKKQLALLTNLLQEMKVNFFIRQPEKDDTLMTEKEFYAKIDRAIKQAEEGKVHKFTPELEKELFKSIL